MSSIFARVTTAVRRLVIVLCIPALAVCSSDTGTGTVVVGSPGIVNDLAAGAATDATVALSFTQVDDGSGSAASYDVRYAAGAISWGTATSVATGSCATPVHGSSVGAQVSCVVQGLSAATDYSFQVVAFRGAMGSAVYGGLSNVASAATTGSNNPPPPQPAVTTVTVAPSTASIQAAATITLQATVKDQSGNVMSGQTISWSTNNQAVATVNSSGVVTGVGAGSATITATCAGKSGTSTVTVTSPPPTPVVTTVSLAPPSASIAVGGNVTLQATVKDQNGNTMTGQAVTWSTSNSSVATVSASGVVTGVAAGTATITATSAGKTGTSSITVTAPSGGGTILFQEPFEGNALSSGWYDNTSVLMSTTEHAPNSTASAQYHFTLGATTPTTGGAQRHKFTPTSSLYISYYVKYSANWVGSGQTYHPHEFYAMSTLDGDWDGPSNAYMTVYLEQNYQNGGRPAMYIQDNKSINTSQGTPPNNLVGVTEDRSTSGCNGISESVAWSVVSCYNAPPWYNAKGMVGPVTFQPNPGPGYKNNWNFVEAYYQLNTVVGGVGQADGIMQYWFNGTLIIDRHDVVYRTGVRANLQFEKFLIAPYIGDGSPVDQSMFIDNLVVATSRVP